MDLRVTNALWIISDTHFGHKNIIKFCQRAETHEVIMLSNWIDRIGEDDQILHLGDVFLGKQGSPKRWAKVVARLPGKKFLILGNHDREKRSTYEEIAGFTIIEPFVHRGVAFSHRPVSALYPLGVDGARTANRDPSRAHREDVRPLPGAGWTRNVHGHVHNNPWSESHHAHEGSPLPGKEYINVSVEVTGMAPIQLGQVCPL